MLVSIRINRIILFSICTLSFTLSGCSNYNQSTNDPSITGSDVYERSADQSVEFFDDEAICPIGALYDAQEDVCYIDCDGLSDDQCDDLDRATFGDFEEFIDEGFDGTGQASSDNIEQTAPIAQYTIESDLTLNSIDNQQPERKLKFRQIWRSAKAILPQKMLSQSLSEFHINTDGPDNTLAFVELDENQPGKWIMAFDNADYTNGKDNEFIHTTIHEFGHIVFLGNDQVDSANLANCTHYSIAEGCSRANSYINQFYQQFWLSTIGEHATKVGPDEDEDAIADFYDKYEDQFVSEYSATNPVEDAAEIFTRFVLSKKPPANGPVSEQKILFMYQFDKLVKLRSTIRAKLNAVR